MGTCLRRLVLTVLMTFTLVGAANAGYIQIFGAETRYDAIADTFSVSGAVQIGPQVCCNGFYGTGYQLLTAQVDERGMLLSGSYLLIGTLPQAGISTPSVLVSARVASVSIRAAAFDPNNPLAGGGVSMRISLDSVVVDALLESDPILGRWGRTASYCCDVSTQLGNYVAVADPLRPWASSWNGYFASDYSDISSRPLPEPPHATLIAMALGLCASLRRSRTPASARVGITRRA